MGLPLYSRVLTHSLKKEKTFFYIFYIKYGYGMGSLFLGSQSGVLATDLGLLPSDQTGLRLPTTSSCESGKQPLSIYIYRR